jgi:hypothetical protein
VVDRQKPGGQRLGWTARSASMCHNRVVAPD